MSKFNLSEYETVKERKLRFYNDHPDGRIVVEQINNGGAVLEYAEFKAFVYLTAEDQAKNLPRGTGHALEIRDKDKSISNKGNEYESVNFASWTENCEESAVGRALDNAGYASNGKPSREEMQKVERMEKTLTPKKNVQTTSLKPENKRDRDSLGHTYCKGCGAVVSDKVESYSVEKFGKPLCMNCQKKVSTESTAKDSTS